MTINPQTPDPTPEPACKFEEGCHRVAPCDPGCGAPTLRNRIAAAVDEGFRLHAELEDANLGDSITDSVLAVLPAAVPVPPTTHATVRVALRECIADAIREWHGDWSKTTFAEAADAVLAVLPETARLHDQILTLQAELATVRGLLRTENERANSAIDRETTAEEAEEEQRLALSQVLDLGTGAPWDAIRERAAELRRLADETQQQETTVDKAAALGMTDTEYRAHSHRAAMDAIQAAVPGLYASVALRVEDALAEAQQQPDTETRPARGDQFEAWLKAQRDEHGWQGSNDRSLYDVLDNVLDTYRLHADTGTPLGQHVCEAGVVGQCECLEQPASGPGRVADEEQPEGGVQP